MPDAVPHPEGLCIIVAKPSPRRILQEMKTEPDETDGKP